MLTVNNMTSKCSHCGRFVSSTDGVKCIKCSSLSHTECVKLSPNGPVPSKWACHSCQKRKNKQNKDIAQGSSTPIPKPVTAVPKSSAATAPATAVNDSMQDDLTNSIVSELRLLRSEMASFRGEIAQLNSTLSEFNSRVEKIEMRLSHLEEQSASRRSEEDGSVQAKLSEIQFQLNEREQDLLMNDVQISGLQETSGENLISVSCLLAKKLGVELSDKDIVSVERSGPRRVTSASAGDGVQEPPPRPRPVVVRLARRALRDALLRAARVRRGADSSGIIDAQARRFYVNEHLTRINRQLFYKAREEGRHKNWRFVWTKGGRIYIRQTAEAPVHRVKSEADIARFFGNASF